MSEARKGLFLIYARASNGVIGKDNALPWRLPADLKRFKALTMNKPMIMGRKTFESLPGLLPGRRHIVLTRDAGWSADGAEVVTSVEAALALAGMGEVAVVGGAEVYRLFMPLAERVELTEVHGDFDGDTVMPPLGPEWHETTREEHPADGARPAHTFVTLHRA
ncbi:MAG: diacylglycerol kinase [Novosphingobium sp. 17-62-19]|uniref:dihydrofolate reductase n=1 Tax=Novosphingobium sp. 17-62-19 TaxID=1970406 RepID=UPI000BDDD3F5|nr:dihydrofolate reductase [Novosphingobium sp. 17-62-19]OZA17057.1 MAG: diacylglycerol kinase [Novosphingobium sp. 17-62-19]HQS95357.1 dihydrofolate reductase [Novosphingobium sp.]